MEKRVQLKTWRFGLDWLGSKIGWEFWWIGGEPGGQQFVVGKVVDHGLPLTCHILLGQIEDCFGMEGIDMIEIYSCDGQHVGKASFLIRS